LTGAWPAATGGCTDPYVEKSVLLARSGRPPPPGRRGERRRLPAVPRGGAWRSRHSPVVAGYARASWKVVALESPGNGYHITALHSTVVFRTGRQYRSSTREPCC